MVGALVTLGGLLLPGMRRALLKDAAAAPSDEAGERDAAGRRAAEAGTGWALLISRSKACGKPVQNPRQPAFAAAEGSTTARRYARTLGPPPVAREVQLRE